MLRVLYPDHPWEDKFGLLKDTTRVSPGHWNDNKNLLREMDKAETKLGLTTVPHFHHLLPFPFSLF